MDIGPTRTGIPLHGGSAQSDPERIADAARQLETQFAKLLISSMRSTTMGDSMFPGSSEHFRDMYDQQLAESLARGKGLGLQDMIRKQLGGETATTPKTALEQYEQASRMFPMDGYQRLPGASGRAQLADPASLPLRRDAPQKALPMPALRTTVQRADATPPAVTNAPETASSTPAAAPCDGTPAANPRPGTPEAFVAEIWPHAQRAAAELGVCPKVLVAQAALETGWGRHTIRGKSGEAHNLFGIKASGSWQGQAVTNSTREFVGGVEVRENAAFRAYRSIADSFSDYVSLLKNTPRYAAAIGQQTSRAFASALQRAGYATDPQYAAKLTAIAEGPTLNRALAQIGGPAT